MYIRKRFNCIKSKSLINNCGKNGNIYFVRIYLFINVKKKKRKVITVFSLLSSLILFIRWFLPTFKVFKYWSVLYYVYKRTFYSILICFVSKKQRCSEPFIYNAVESSLLPSFQFLLLQLPTFSYIKWNNTQARLADSLCLIYRQVKYYIIIPHGDKIKSYILLEK